MPSTRPISNTAAKVTVMAQGAVSAKLGIPPYLRTRGCIFRDDGFDALAGADPGPGTASLWISIAATMLAATPEAGATAWHADPCGPCPSRHGSAYAWNRCRRPQHDDLAAAQTGAVGDAEKETQRRGLRIHRAGPPQQSRQLDLRVVYSDCRPDQQIASRRLLKMETRSRQALVHMIGPAMYFRRGSYVFANKKR